MDSRCTKKIKKIRRKISRGHWSLANYAEMFPPPTYCALPNLVPIARRRVYLINLINIAY